MFLHDIPTAIAYDVMRAGGKYRLVYEKGFITSGKKAIADGVIDRIPYRNTNVGDAELGDFEPL